MILFGQHFSLLGSVLVISSNLLERKDYYYLRLVLLACQHWFVVTAQCPVAALCVVLGGVAAPVVFDAGLVWSASCKGNLVPPPPYLSNFA